MDMWTRETSKRIGEILNLIAETPNLKAHSRDSSIKVFDGGLMRVITTGLTGYEFTDGTQATYGMGLDICLTIVFPSGEKVTVRSLSTYCAGCLHHLSADLKYCPNCGLENPKSD
jgi:hypothetical protein